MVEVRRLLGRHYHVVSGFGGGDAAFLTAPAHDGRTRSEAAIEDLVPPDETPPARGEPFVEVRDEPALQLVLVLEPGLLHPRLRDGAGLPLRLRALVAADVDELRREK